MKKVCFVFQWVIILLMGFAFIAAAAEKTSDRRYTLPDHGVFLMKVPASWKDDVQQPPDKQPPTIAFTPASGNLFLILILPVWKEKKDAPSLTDETTRQKVQDAADANQPIAAEKKLKIIELQGSAGRGYYFSATDKAPEPGNPKFLTQGILLVGELAVAFSILTNDDTREVESAALTMLKSAIHVKEKGN
jgi:hypothetical protein